MLTMTDQAVAWVRYQQALTPDRPFFIYFAPGSVHAPHHVPKEWADRYAGRFDEAGPVIEQALAMNIEIHGEPSLEVAACYENKAVLVQMAQRDYAAAEELTRKGFEARRAVSDTEAPCAGVPSGLVFLGSISPECGDL